MIKFLTILIILCINENLCLSKTIAKRQIAPITCQNFGQYNAITKKCDCFPRFILN